jgi:hypothetical protein
MSPISLLPPPSIAMVLPVLKPVVDATSRLEFPATTAEIVVVDPGVTSAINEEAVDEGVV